MKNKFLKLIGHKWENRFTWGEFVWHPKIKHWDLSLRLTDTHEELHDMIIFKPFICSFYVYFPTKFCVRNNWSSEDKHYGFYIYESLGRFIDIVLEWGRWSKRIEMPWNYKHESTELLTHDGKVCLYKETRNNKLRHDNSPDSNWDIQDKLRELVGKKYPFKYKLKRGETQDRIATVYVSRMTWKMKWLPWVKKIRTSIDIKFSDEVGEETGSWKGGCIGCGYDMLSNETAEQCLKRMEKERIF